MPRRAVLICWIISSLPSQRLPSQQASDFDLRGTVVTESGEPLSYGIIEVQRVSTRLTDQNGRFQIGPLVAGKYGLVVRQIGYIPFDSTIDVPLKSPLRIRLKRLGVLLSPVSIARTPECRYPGPPNATATPDLSALFDQLVANARRMRLLAAEFPHTTVVQRTFTDTPLPVGRVEVHRDTLSIKSTEFWQYRPGRVVGRTPYEEDYTGRRILT